MKELSIEEKARRYDEAIERAKAYQGLRSEIEIIFPELKESEDEGIRKGIIRCVKGNMPDNDFRKKYIAWLEKQGEKKSVIIIPKFRIGDEIKTANEESLTITKIDEKGYWSEDLFICGFEEECIWDLKKEGGKDED